MYLESSIKICARIEISHTNYTNIPVRKRVFMYLIFHGEPEVKTFFVIYASSFTVVLLKMQRNIKASNWNLLLFIITIIFWGGGVGEGYKKVTFGDVGSSMEFNEKLVCYYPPPPPPPPPTHKKKKKKK